jgi:heme iron utilization protein
LLTPQRRITVVVLQNSRRGRGRSGFFFLQYTEVMTDAEAARRLFLKASYGVLSTISLDVPGYPFGSVTPYCADEACRPILYISSIAQHTHNILADPRISLIVVESGDSDDVQARGRVTCVGKAVLLPERESRSRERYFRYFPAARQYEDTHDFAFFRIETVRVRFIGGFGRIYWLTPEAFMITNPFTADQESAILQHMNQEHHDTLRKFAGDDAAMVGIDGEGFDVLKNGSKIRFAFDTPVRNLDDARQALVRMARQA